VLLDELAAFLAAVVADHAVPVPLELDNVAAGLLRGREQQDEHDGPERPRRP
jgi:hypothetical protein